MSSTDLDWPAIILTITAILAGLGMTMYERFESSKPYKPTTNQQILNDINLQKDTILRLKNPYTGIPCSIQSQLDARTIPNARLQTVFGIENAFTTRDIKTANAFKAAARTKLRDAVKITKKIGEDGTSLPEDTDAQWEHIITSIRQFVREELNGTNEIINLAELVQFITLKISLLYLFNPGEDALSDRKAIMYVAKTINILWLRSKNTSLINGESTWPDEHRFQAHLNRLTGLDATNPTTNPLTFILPAYETMWRAVLRGILEIYFRNAPESASWQSLLREFLDDPTKEVFRKEDSSTTLCALDIVKEILRKYPPTRRVNRRFPDDPPHLLRSANIETSHHNTLLIPLGPADANLFRPNRWLEIKHLFKDVKLDAQERMRGNRRDAAAAAAFGLSDFEEFLGYMPFALVCPAGGRVSQGFGFRMVAGLVGGLCEGFDGLGEKEIEEGDGRDGGDGVVGGDDRGKVEGHGLWEDSTSENIDHDSSLNTQDEIPADELHELTQSIDAEDLDKDVREPRLQKWKLQTESPGDELPPIGTALKSERSDYLSLVYRRVV